MIKKLPKSPAVSETVVVEGRDDAAAVGRAVDAVCIMTHGFGISKDTWKLLENAYERTGLIILTDPDHSGEEIRRKVSERFPGAKHAYVPRAEAEKDGDIGVENAAPEAIERALRNARATFRETETEEIPAELLYELGLSGGAGSKELRRKAGAALGIGYGNAAAFAKKLRGFGIGPEELIKTVDEIRKQGK